MTTGIVAQTHFDIENYRTGMLEVLKHGYDCIDFQYFMHRDNIVYSMDSEELKRIGLYANSIGLVINQAHGPWEKPNHSTENARNEWLDLIKKAVCGCENLGCKNLAVHPIMPYGYFECCNTEEVDELNYKFFCSLSKFAEKHNVVICLENMPFDTLTLSTPKDILKMVKRIDSPFMKVCLDTGHSSIRGVNPADAVREIGKDYLCILHVHDNDTKTDYHWNPFFGRIDWRDFSSALYEIGFEGTVSLETECLSEPSVLIEERQILLNHSACCIAYGKFE